MLHVLYTASCVCIYFRFFEYEIIQRVFTTMSLNENNEEVKVNSTIFEPVATDLRKNHTYSKVRRCILL